jgi:hypothetical protein
LVLAPDEAAVPLAEIQRRFDVVLRAVAQLLTGKHEALAARNVKVAAVVEEVACMSVLALERTLVEGSEEHPSLSQLRVTGGAGTILEWPCTFFTAYGEREPRSFPEMLKDDFQGPSPAPCSDARAWRCAFEREVPLAWRRGSRWAASEPWRSRNCSRARR